jgi:hypothetical protein
VRCQYCAYENPLDYAFCGECGRRRVDAEFLGNAAVREASSGKTSVAAASTDAFAAQGAVSTFAASVHTMPRQEERATEATRYLCAAVHMDSSLADTLIREIVDEEHRGIASSPGVDLAAVLRHALDARRRQVARDAALATTLIVLLVAVLFGGPALAALFFFFALAIMWIIVFWETLVTYYSVLARTMRRSVFRPEAAPEPPKQRHQQRLAEIADRDAGNVTVYGAFSPFVGHGLSVEAWSFVLDVTKPADEGGTVEKFTVPELHNFVDGKLQDLGLPRLSVEHRVFVNGLDIRDDSRFLPRPLESPVTSIDIVIERHLLEHPEDRARPYTGARVVGWDGELSLTTFLRFVLLPRHLFTEASFCLLTPVREIYHDVDRLLPHPTLRQTIRISARAAWQTPKLVFFSIPSVIRAVFEPIAHARRLRRQRREIAAELSFNYGALVSPLELASDRQYQRYFQRLDKEMYAKVVERRILDALVEFFELHGIATDDLVDRQTTILNNGVMVTGQAKVEAGSMAVGAGAKAKSGIDKKE